MSSNPMFRLERGEEQDFICETHGVYRGRPYRLLGISDPSWRPAECPKCRADAEERERIASLEDEARRKLERLERKQRLAGIPVRFRGATLEGYSCELPVQQQVKTVFERYAENFAAARRVGRSVMLTGRPGTGKTHLMCALAQRLMFDWLVLYTDCYSMLSAVKGTFRRGAEETEDQVVARYVAPDLLLIDEVGVQYGTDAERAILHRILDLRYQQVKPTVVAGNVDEAGMAAYLGERAVSRLHEATGIKLKCDWSDHRKKVAA